MRPLSAPVLLIAAMTGLVAGFGVGWKATRAETVSADPGAARKGRPSPGGEEGGKSKLPATPPASREAPEVHDARPFREALSPKMEFVRLIFERWPKEQRHHLLWELFIRTPAAQRRLFDHLMATSDTAAWEAGQDFLIRTLDKELARSLAEAYEKETIPARRAMLAYALAANANHPATHASLHAALDTHDEALLRRTLTRLNLSDLKNHPDACQRVEARLRAVVGSGMNQEVRLAAIRSLRGGESEGTIRFLLDLVLRDSSSAIQKEAMGSLPISHRPFPPLLKEHLDVFRMVIRDTSRDVRIRMEAAEYLRDQSRMSRTPLSEPDRAIVDALLEKQD